MRCPPAAPPWEARRLAEQIEQAARAALSSRPRVPLSSIQTEALQVLARSRDPESYVAGSTPLNRSSVRFSQDIDIFHDDAQRVAAQAATDVEILRQHSSTSASPVPA